MAAKVHLQVEDETWITMKNRKQLVLLFALAIKHPCSHPEADRNGSVSAICRCLF
jgi:hypothetical protein